MSLELSAAAAAAEREFLRLWFKHALAEIPEQPTNTLENCLCQNSEVRAPPSLHSQAKFAPSSSTYRWDESKHIAQRHEVQTGFKP